ncbi:MAG: aminopeptidase N, partial [Mariprofundus sp.]|nr:aminopeptidase N [Mariprofundus sp.]
MTQVQTIYLKDYQPPAFLVEQVALTFSLHPSATEVVSTVQYRRNRLAALGSALVLDGYGQDGHGQDGHGLDLLSVKLNGEALQPSDFSLHKHGLNIADVPDAFELEITTRINPDANTALEGLYRSGGNYCTQCEAQGFRRITYYQDRPDVMAPFSVRIIADKVSNAVLLSNGNPVGHGDLADGRHWVQWQDPFPKPCYLFALVAGNLSCVEDQFTTLS